MYGTKELLRPFIIIPAENTQLLEAITTALVLRPELNSCLAVLRTNYMATESIIRSYSYAISPHRPHLGLPAA